MNLAKRRAVSRLLALVLGALLATACVNSTPPVAKIGLIAPFEGLARETGYAALDGLRAAIDECSPVLHTPGDAVAPGFVPLALDDSHGIQSLARTKAKLQIDPAVILIVAPVTAVLSSPTSQPVSTPQSPRLLLPALVQENGQFADGNNWAAALAYYIRTVSQTVSQTAPHSENFPTNEARLLVTGIPDTVDSLLNAESPDRAAPNQEDPAARSGDSVPILLPATRKAEWAIDIAAIYTPGDILLWLETGPESVEQLAAIRRILPHLPIILGPEASTTRLARHFLPPAGEDPHYAPLYWAVWSNDGYTDWVTRHLHPGRPLSTLPSTIDSVTSSYHYAYLVYQATCAAMNQGVDENDAAIDMATLEERETWRQKSAATEWTLHLFTLTDSH